MREMIRVALPSSQSREADSDDWAHDWRQISPIFSTPLLLDIPHWAALLPERDDLAAAHELVVVGPQLELSARRLDDALWKETKTIRGNAELDPEFITAEWRSVRLLAQEPSQPQYVSDTVDRVISNLASEIDLYRAAVANVNEIVNRFGLLTA